MLKCMVKVELGIMDPQVFKRAECARKVFELKRTELFTAEQVEFTGITAMDLSADGKFLVIGGVTGMNHIYRTWGPKPSQKMEFQMPAIHKSKQFHSKFVSRVQWHPADVGMYSSSSRDGSLAIWYGEESRLPVIHYGDIKTGGKEGYHCHHMNPHDPPIIAAACTAKTGFHIIDLRLNAASLRIPQLHPIRGGLSDGSEVQEVRWHPVNSSILCLGSEKGHLYEWDIRSASEPIMSFGSFETTQAIFVGHKGMASSVRYGKNGVELYSLGTCGFLKKWSTWSGNLLGSVSVFKPRPKPTFIGGGLQRGMLYYLTSMSYSPTFCITEETSPSIAFVPGDNCWMIVGLNEMEVLKRLVSCNLKGHHNTSVYDPHNHLYYTGGNVLALYAPATAYNQYCLEVLERPAVHKFHIDLADLS